MFWDICSKRPNVLGQDLTEEDNRAKICFDKSETESDYCLKRGHHFPVFFIPKKLMLKGFVIVLVLMPFSNKKSTIDLQRKDLYSVLLCISKRSCPRTFGLLFDLCSFVPKHLALLVINHKKSLFSN